MACDTQFLEGQTVTERKEEIREAVAKLNAALVSGKAKVIISAQGAVAFTGLSDSERGRVTDACAYRRLMVSGSALAKAKIAQAEQVSGRSINKQVVGQGVHSHDGGKTWHNGH